MSGSLIQVMPKRVFDFSKNGVSTFEVCTVAERIDVSQHIDGMLAVRVHALNTPGGQIFVSLVGDGFTEDDPALSFQSSLSPFVGFVLSGTAPFLQTFGGTLPGQFAAIRITGNRISAAALSATLSVDLILRSPDDT